MGAALAVDDESLHAGQLQKPVSKLLGDRQILGLSVLYREGSLLARAGDADFDDFNVEAVVRDPRLVARHRIRDDQRYDIAWMAAAANPSRAHDFRMDERPRDEHGDMFEMHNQLLRSVAESKPADCLRAEERALFLTRHDPLTGLLNRMFFLL